MIELYRTAGSPTGQEVEDALKELVLAHRVITVEPNRPPAALPPDTRLPALIDEGEIISGPESLKAHLHYLKHMAFEWRKFQSDSCYTDEANC